MARSVVLTSLAAETIAGQVGQFLSATGSGPLRNDSFELGETFAVWELPFRALTLAHPLAEATDTQNWHHQVYRDGQAAFFAYSSARDLTVKALLASRIAADVDGAIGLVDGWSLAEEETRLLVIPAFQIQALWAVSPERDTLTRTTAPEAYRRALPMAPIDAGDFFERLRTLDRVRGMLAL